MTVADRPTAQRYPAAEAEQRILDQTLAILEERRIGKSYSELARLTGISRPMLRAMELDGIPPGLDSLALLLNWDEETFGSIVLDYLKHRGKLLKTRTDRLT